MKKKESKNKGEERVSTGVSNFDSLIEGGFEKGSVNLIVGGSGSGKTIFATQFMIEGMKKGEKCLYVTFQEKKDSFFKNMKSFGWDLESYAKKDLFTFLEYTPEKVKLMLEEGGGSIESIILTKKIDRLVIDSLTSFALLFTDDLARRESTLSLFNMIRSWNCTSLITLDEEPSLKEKSETQKFEFESDSTTLIYHSRMGSERKRCLEVIKMRGTSHSNKVFPLLIENKGITLRKAPLTPKELKVFQA